MPPRIRSSSCQPQLLLNYLEPAPASALTCSAGVLARPSASSSSSSPQCSRPFSTTPAPQVTRIRRKFIEWTKGKGGDLFKEPVHNSTNYVSRIMTISDDLEVPPNTPFPNNLNFVSERVLSEVARERIWRDVMVKGLPLKAVSAEYSVDMRRVAAVVRMKAIEKKWDREGKPMARPYSRAILNMLPHADLRQSDGAFEPINDIHVHSYTTQQLFVPVSESREFTRADAAKAFGDKILPPDSKMRIPELVQLERNIAGGMDPHDARKQFISEAAASERVLADKQMARLQAEEERKTRVDAGRFEFRFEKFNAENVGPTGRARNAVGWRYGVPFMDRRRGEVKIPTSVG